LRIADAGRDIADAIGHNAQAVHQLTVASTQPAPELPVRTSRLPQSKRKPCHRRSGGRHFGSFRSRFLHRSCRQNASCLSLRCYPS
jgi:hypothetical protein